MSTQPGDCKMFEFINGLISTFSHYVTIFFILVAEILLLTQHDLY